MTKEKNKASEKIKGLVSKVLVLPEHDITDESNIYNDLGADSLDCVEIVMEVEKEFNITIPDEKAENWSTVLDILKTVEELS